MRRIDLVVSWILFEFYFIIIVIRVLERNGVLEWVDNVKRDRGRPKLTWDESVKRRETLRIGISLKR